MKDDEIFCPECGAPIKKGFFTCTNCKLKVGLSIQWEKEKGRSFPQVNKKKVTEDNSCYIFGFPLAYMEPEQVKSMMTQILSEIP